ncbi:hypothetical protein PV05_01453 [Exophiala xenobiotica]|uniref:Uncharacterized protein n=1 Tax=Exophiala xenobiotica TaxID=348802 RepID=A0A0D2DG78_9EURO|nr:uncharacterized protein PV05_01453 [Exophiala xenobiotica]KIW61317.1 hypothetical protein PV05_01453 [Exophiala xenobiotica]
MIRILQEEANITNTGTMAIQIMTSKVQVKAVLVDRPTRAADRIFRDIQVHEVNDTIKNRRLVSLKRLRRWSALLLDVLGHDFHGADDTRYYREGIQGQRNSRRDFSQGLAV